MSNSPSVMDVWQVHATGDSLEIHTTGTASEVAALSCNDPLAVVDPVPFVDPDNTVVNGQMICREVLKPGDRLVWLASPCGEVVQRVVFEADTYCQVLGRTWNPRFLAGGIPLTMNFFFHETIPLWMKVALREVLKMSPPRTWQPPVDEEGESGSRLREPEFWLPAFGRRWRRRRG